MRRRLGVCEAAGACASALLGLGRLRALLGPRLVELDAPLAVLGLLQRQARAEALAGAALEAGDRLLGAAGLDQLLGDRDAAAACPPWTSRSRSRSPGPRATSTSSPCGSRRCRGRRPGRDRGWRAGIRTSLSLVSSSPTVLSVNLTMSPMNASRESWPVSILRQAVLPLAGQPGRGQRVLAEQADHVHALLGDDQRAAVALDVADLEQALDDRRARRGRADPGILHRLAQLLVVDELAGGLHRAEQRAFGVAARRLGLLLLSADLGDLGLLAAARASAAAARAPRRRRCARRRRRTLAVDAAPAGDQHQLAAGAEHVLATVVSTRVFSNTASGWKIARNRRTTRS